MGVGSSQQINMLINNSIARRTVFFIVTFFFSFPNDDDSSVSGELLEHVEEGLEVDDRPVGAGPQRLLESVAPEAETVDHVVGVDDARHFVRRQIPVLIPVFRTQSRTHFTGGVGQATVTNEGVSLKTLRGTQIRHVYGICLFP